MRALIASLAAIALGPLLLAVLIAVPARPAPAQPAGQCTAGESVTAFGEWFSPDVQLDTQVRSARQLVPQLGTSAVAVRLQVAATSPTGARWTLVLREPKLRILAILSEQDFARGGATAQWTGRLESPQVSAQLIGGGPGVRIAFVAGMALPKNSEGVNVFSSQVAGRPNWADPYEERPELLYRQAAEAVGMMVTGAQALDGQGVARKGTWCCSGAMLTSDIYITNWHCGGTRGVPDEGYWNDQVCANTVLDLGWHSGVPARRQYACERVLHQNKRLDYALLRVRPIVGPGAATGRALPVKISTQLPSGNQVFMVHHAQCKPKLVSFNRCDISGRSHRAWTDPASMTGGPDLTHTCDTEPGASGAPVFDTTGRMIALHHVGFQQGGPQCESDRLNKAVTMASILDDLKAARPPVHAEIVAGGND